MTGDNETNAKTSPHLAPNSAASKLLTNELGTLIGSIVQLYMLSPAHRHLFFSDLEWMVIPAITHRQMRLIQRGGKPFAYVSWAFLNEEGKQRITAGVPRLKPSDWTAGDNAWIVDLVAPFGGLDAILKELKEKAFPDRDCRYHALSESGQSEIRIL